ncbi:MAG: SynChlorMet cassette radical SAM/SPASM protein ScmE [Desulfobulbales bacterium]|nr:SynChlorMet cassette radical SAM/SPASM protein ScmE [Desulfobulbales bacterium]
MRTPRSVDLEITSRCNLRCRYCYYFDNKHVTYRDLPTENWLQFIDELGQCAVMDVCLAGGEPFIREDLPELIRAIVKNNMRFTIVSNGTLANDPVAEIIAGTGRCDSVQVSIDGSCAEVHETGRGKGSFARAVRGIKIMQGHGIPVHVRVTIHRQNVDDLENTARFLLEELGLPAFSTNAAGYFGSCRKNGEDLLLRVAERQKAMDILLQLEQRYGGRITAQAGPLSEAHAWTRMEKGKQADAPQFANGGRLTGCGCTRAKIAVRADGTIIPCTMLAHLELGRINHDPLERTWQQSPVLKNLRQRQNIPLAGFKECSSCSYVKYCTGNCPGLAYNFTGEPNRPSPDACLQKFLAEGGRIPGFVKSA